MKKIKIALDPNPLLFYSVRAEIENDFHFRTKQIFKSFLAVAFI